MKFLPRHAFSGSDGYRLLPLRFRRVPWDTDRVFVSSMSGEWVIVPYVDFARIVNGNAEFNDPLLMEFECHNLIVRDVSRSTLAPLLSQYRSRKAAIAEGPALHIIVVSLRCHHTCAYCQVSRQPTQKSRFDMSAEVSHHVIDRLFDSPAKTLTVEFQGGEPLLHFDRVRALIEGISSRNRTEGRRIRYVVASTLHNISRDQLLFLKDFDVNLSTSLDGPEWLHNANRPRPERDSYQRTVTGMELARSILGESNVSALTTLTRKSLEAPREIVDEYRKLGLRSIFLRPLSPYGFARKTAARNGYQMDDFLAFYRIALEHIIETNKKGYAIDEAYASLLLSQLMTPFPHGYVDLRSPTGAGLGALVYDYDGRVYPSDEARMLAAMGDHSFALGRVEDEPRSWFASDAMKRLLTAGVAESIPQCADCAFVPLCGADPIDHYARQGDPVGHRPSSEFCKKQMGMFDILLERFESGDLADRAIFERWALPKQTTDNALEEST
jgi:His-Xaa-Ser system radical SAM maturase HxsB